MRISTPTYTGTGRTSAYLQERSLCEAARNNHKITSFFLPQHKRQGQAISQATSPTAASDPELPSSPIDFDSDIISTHENSVTMTASESESGAELPVGSNHVASPIPDHVEPVINFLDTTEDDNDTDEARSEPVLTTVKKLMVEAKKYKSFTSLFHLNALAQFIDLWTKYQHIPKVKAPKRKASHAVAVSIGKGPYMA
jgi:hypothetical protein